MLSSPDLPLELQNEILAHCGWQEKLALRLVCRSWYESTTDALFNEHTLVCFAWSLKKLRAISRSRLAERVKVLTVYSMVLSGCCLRQDVEPYESFKWQMSLLVRKVCDCQPPRGRVYYVWPENWPEAYARYLEYRELQLVFLRRMKKLGKAVRRLSLRSLVVRHFEDDYDPRTRHLRPALSLAGYSVSLAKELTRMMRSSPRNHEVVPALLQGVGSSLRRLAIKQDCSRLWDVSLPVMLEDLDLEVEECVMDTRESSEGAEMAMRGSMHRMLNCPSLQRLRVVSRRRASRGESLRRHAFLDQVLLAEWPCLTDVSLTLVASNAALLAFPPGKQVEMNHCYIEDVPGFLEALPRMSVEINHLYEWNTAEIPFEWPYFPNGLDDATREWMKGGPRPVWEKEEPPKVEDCYCGRVDPCDDIPLDVVFERERVVAAVEMIV